MEANEFHIPSVAHFEICFYQESFTNFNTHPADFNKLISRFFSVVISNNFALVMNILLATLAI